MLGLPALAPRAAVAQLGVGTPTAQATPFLTSFDNAYLKTAALTGAGADVLDVPPTNAAGSRRRPQSRHGRVQRGGFNSELIVPEIGGIATTIDFDETEQITGTIDIATGSVVTNPSAYRAILTVDPTPGNPGDEDTCVVGDEPGGADTADLVLAFSTEADYPTPYRGDRFTDGEGQRQKASRTGKSLGAFQLLRRCFRRSLDERSPCNLPAAPQWAGAR